MSADRVRRCSQRRRNGLEFAPASRRPAHRHRAAGCEFPLRDDRRHDPLRQGRPQRLRRNRSAPPGRRGQAASPAALLRRHDASPRLPAPAPPEGRHGVSSVTGLNARQHSGFRDLSVGKLGSGCEYAVNARSRPWPRAKHRAEVIRETKETKSGSPSMSMAPENRRLRRASAFSITCWKASPSIRPWILSSKRPATFTSTSTTPWRMSASSLARLSGRPSAAMAA